MPVTPDTLREALEANIPIHHLEIIDQSGGCGSNYALVIVSEVSSQENFTCMILTWRRRHSKGNLPLLGTDWVSHYIRSMKYDR
jgi:hypothetical protein